MSIGKVIVVSRRFSNFSPEFLSRSSTPKILYLHSECIENLQYIKRALPNVACSAVIFNGETMGSGINIHEI